MIKNFKKFLEFEIMIFYVMNMTEHDFIFEISWLTAHNSIMNWDTELWYYCLTDDWIMIEESEIFMQFIQNEETVF